MSNPRPFARSIAAILAAALTSGCVALSPRTSAGTTAPADRAALQTYYRYATPEEPPAVVVEQQTPRYTLKRVRLPAAMKVLDGQNEIVVEYYESTAPGKRPALLVYPILGGDYPLERAFAKFFATHGFHAALVYREKFKVGPERTAPYIESLLRQGVIKNRQVIDWLVQQPTVDAGRLGAFGISMGGVNAANTAAVESRLKAHAIILGGGSLADMVRDSKDSLITKPRRRYLEANHMTLEEMHRRLSEEIKTDPLKLAPYVDGRTVFMTIALFDRTVTSQAGFRLWRALGRPRVWILPCGHYTAYLTIPFVERACLQFFREQLHVAPLN